MVNNRCVWGGVVVACLGACGLGGCAGDAPRTDKLEAVEAQIELPTMLRSADAALKINSHSQFVSGDSREQKTLSVTRTLPPDEQGQWTIRKVQVRDGQEDLTTLSELTMALDPASGDVSLVRSIEAEDDVLTEFVPPLVVLKGEMKPGATFQQSLKVIVHPRSEPAKIKSQGMATHELSWVEATTVRTPAGVFAAVHGRGVLKIDLDKAQVVNTTDQWFAVGVGLVAETRREQVTVFGLPLRSKSESWVLGKE